MDKYNTQAVALEREETIHLEERKQRLVLLLGITLFLGEFYIEEVFLGFSLRGFPGINLCVLFCYVMLVILLEILLFLYNNF